MRNSPRENEETGAGAGAGAWSWALASGGTERSWGPPSKGLPSPGYVGMCAYVHRECYWHLALLDANVTGVCVCVVWEDNDMQETFLELPLLSTVSGNI